GAVVRVGGGGGGRGRTDCGKDTRAYSRAYGDASGLDACDKATQSAGERDGWELLTVKWGATGRGVGWVVCRRNAGSNEDEVML
ncbi:unnamed protein product, partial [Tilletia caries]